MALGLYNSFHQIENTWGGIHKKLAMTFMKHVARWPTMQRRTHVTDSKWRTIQQQAHLANCPNVNLLADSPLANCFADCQYANYHVDSHVAYSQYAISLEDCPSENKLADK
ncbi:hypothetical protein ES319_A05G416800v1 [Gossypium barbadense]|uniref:Uncharacterized protein n=2 Tax=Gossypium TaxID=3633 RepID=A0A5J5W162_GOSBA|nr:hypothetical protein ES319_A05G416800v1 [Gossypium barbadense]